jgi:hypothetical protein
MSHAIHELPRLIFGDDCEECVDRCRTIDGLGALDSENIVALGSMVKALKEHRDLRPKGWSYADVKACETLASAARIVFASGVQPEDVS